MFKQVWRYAVILFALLLILVGLITFPLPLPIGLILMLAGAGVLITVSRRARLLFRWLRRRYPAIDKGISRVEPHLPAAIRNALRHDN